MGLHRLVWGRELGDGLRTATVVGEDAARTTFPIWPLGLTPGLTGTNAGGERGQTLALAPQ